MGKLHSTYYYAKYSIYIQANNFYRNAVVLHKETSISHRISDWKKKHKEDFYARQEGFHAAVSAVASQ